MNYAWNVGVARTDITPQEPIALAGWGAHRISEGATHELWAKALALQDAQGHTAVLVSTDLLGLSRDMSEELAARALRKFGLQREQLIINSSHNHAGPVVGDSLHLYYELSDLELGVVARYTAWLLDKIELLIGAALDSLEPSTLHFEQGFCGFGVNRRRDRPAYPHARALAQVVDQDVPVLTIKGYDEKVRAIVFGYACHPTAYAVPKLCGDWPGFSQIEIERQFPGSTALFVAGCGGDINPLPRFGRYHEELSEMYGKLLAASVCGVLDAPMTQLAATLSTAFEEATLTLQTAPSLALLQEQLDEAKAQALVGIRVREIEHQMQKLERGEKLAASAPFPIHVWKLGALNFIALSGEPVVDYAHRFKAQHGVESTWVTGYNNELTSYIPSRRVLEEGGYEGTDGMREYGWPTSYRAVVEEVIAETVNQLHRGTII
jgi:hypothetical protein